MEIVDLQNTFYAKGGVTRKSTWDQQILPGMDYTRIHTAGPQTLSSI